MNLKNNSFSKKLNFQIGTGERSWLTLKNGMRIIFHPAPSIDLVSIYLRIGVGSNYEIPYMGAGISHFVEHAVFLGSRKFPERDQFSREIERFGAIDFNAYTTYDHTAFFFSVFSKYLAESLDALYDFIRHPNFEAKAVLDEKGTIFSEMDMYRDNVSDWFYHFVLYSLFEKQPYKFPVIGLRKEFEKLNADDLIKYHQKYYKPQNIILSLVGNFDLVETKKIVVDTFEDRILKSKKLESKVKDQSSRSIEKLFPVQYPYFKSEKKLAFDECYQTTHERVKFLKVTFSWPTVGLKDLSKDRFALELLSYLLASDKGSFLYDELKEKRDLVENVSSYFSVYRESGFFFITVSLKNLRKDRRSREKNRELNVLRKKMKQIEDLIYDLLGQIETWIDKKVLDGVKDTFIKYFIDEQESYLNQAMSLAESLSEWGHLKQDQIFLNEIRKVTPKQIHEMIYKYILSLSGKKFSKKKIALLPPSLFEQGKLYPQTISKKDYENDLLKDVAKKNYKTLNWVSTKKPFSGKTDLGKNKVETSTTIKHVVRLEKNKNKKITGQKTTLLFRRQLYWPKTYLVLRFSGGVLYEDASLKMSDIYKKATLKNSLNQKNILPGSFNFLAQMLFTSNRQYSKLELFRYFKENAIDYYSVAGESSIMLAFSFLSSKFDLVLDLLDSILSNPNFDKNDLEKERNNIRYDFEKANESIDFLAARYFKNHFFKGTRLALPTEGDMKLLDRITEVDLLTLKNSFLLNPQVTSLYGDFHESQQKILSCWIEKFSNSSSGISKDGKSGSIHSSLLEFENFDFNRNGLIRKYEKNFNQSIFYMAYRVPGLGHEDSPILEVLNSYLSGLGGPLFQLRSESFKKGGADLGGRAYRLGSSYKISGQYGMYVFYINFRFEARNEYEWAIESFLKLLNYLKKSLIPIIELDRAKNILMARHSINSVKLFHRIRQESYYEFTGLGYRYLDGYQKKIQQVTPEKIKSIVSKYFDDRRFMVQVVLPRKK